MPEITDQGIDQGWWDIARAGKWKGSLAGETADIKITQQDLEDMAADYSTGIEEAALNTDHDSFGPAHGWVAALRVAGDRLQAQFKLVSDELREWLKTGAYRSRSIQMHKPHAETGRAYLTGVALLGAGSPAVKGLNPTPFLFLNGESAAFCWSGEPDNSQKSSTQPEEFQMDEKDLKKTVSESVRDGFKSFFGQGEGKAPVQITLSQADLDAKIQASVKTEVEPVKAELAQATERADKAEAKLAEASREAELAEFSSALEAAKKESKITPAEQESFKTLGSKLDPEGRKTILEQVAGRKSASLMSELSAPGGKDLAAATAVARSKKQFEKFPEDPEHDAAIRLQAANKGMSFADAIVQVREAAAANG